MPNTGVQVTATRRSKHTQIHARLRVPSVLASLGVSFGSLITRAILAATPPHINLRPGGLPGDRAAGHGSRESIRMKATRQGLPLRFTQAWLVACCPTTSPALRWTSPSSSSMSISPARKIVPFPGGTRPTLVLPRSSVQEKSGGLASVTHISPAGLGERKLVSWTLPSNIATAFPEESILVTTRRTSGGLCCCAATDPTSASAALTAVKDNAIFMVLLLWMGL